jgi:hypothetical protein
LLYKLMQGQMGVAKAPGRLRRYRIDLAAGSLREEILALLSLVDFDIEILHSAHDGVAVAPPKPASAIKPAGRDLGASLGAQV